MKKIHFNRKKIVLITLTAIVSLLTLQVAKAVPFSTVNCDDNTHISTLGIPKAECEALEDLWDKTNFSDLKLANWDTLSPVRTWDRIRVSSGKVIGVGDVLLLRNGRLQPSIVNFSELDYLSIRGLGSDIPTFLGELTNLRSLDLAASEMTGSIPPELGRLKKLERLLLFRNKLSGPLPPELGELENLKSLVLFDNKLSGSLPPEIGGLKSLENIDISANKFSGSIPKEFGQLSELRRVIISDNELTGSIPSELGMLKQLRSLDLSNNRLSNTIPEPGFITALRTTNGGVLRRVNLSDQRPDNVTPLLKLNGQANLRLTVGDAYVEQGATAIDNVDGDISANIIISGNVNTNQVGIYTLTYNVSDTAGNSANPVQRIINVQAADTEAPVIRLKGSANLTLTVGEAYVEQGATATDNVDGDISANIIISGNVNSNQVGIYTLTYNVSDTAGNSANPIQRIINVQAVGITTTGASPIPSIGGLGLAFMMCAILLLARRKVQ